MTTGAGRRNRVHRRQRLRARLGLPRGSQRHRRALAPRPHHAPVGRAPGAAPPAASGRPAGQRQDQARSARGRYQGRRQRALRSRRSRARPLRWERAETRLRQGSRAVTEAQPWIPFFGFTSAPFSEEIAVDDLWVPASRERRVDRLIEACHEHEHILLTGEPSVGKTCVLRSLRQRLPEAGLRLTHCHNATLWRRDFYRQLRLALALSPRATAAAVFYDVSQHIHELGAARVHSVFLLDEAHLLHQDVLDHLHILVNYGWTVGRSSPLSWWGCPNSPTASRSAGTARC
ncbi:MAG: ATP-binding protein [Polyangiales bacterium]